MEELGNGNGNISEIEFTKYHSNEVSDKLKDRYLAEHPSLFNFISANIDLNKMQNDKSVIMRSADPYNVKVHKDNSKQLFINLMI